MKFSTIALYLTAAISTSTVQSFTVLPSAMKTGAVATSRSMYFAEEGNKTPTVYDRIGFEEDKIAIGLNPSEILQWLGKYVLVNGSPQLLVFVFCCLMFWNANLILFV